MRRLHLSAPALVVVFAACAGEATGPGILYVSSVGALTDTVWQGAPGEPIPSGVSLRIKGPDGELLPGASVTWEAVGQGAQVLGASSLTNAQGLATAVWVLGTNAAEVQELRVQVDWNRRHRELTLRARATPHIVAQLRVSVDTPAVVRLGDSLPIAVTAIDPYGNSFVAPAPRLSVADTSIGRVHGTSVIGGPLRGRTQLTVESEYTVLTVPLHVVQFVAAVTPAIDTLSFTSLGAELPVTYVLRDDRGGLVADTMAQLVVADTNVARVVNGVARSIAPGVTAVHLSVGPAAATVVLKVQQRVASIAFRRDTIRFDALGDTTTVHGIALDSLGATIAYPQLELETSDPSVVALDSARLIQARTPGIAFAILRDPQTGIQTSVPVVVRQVITAIHPSTTHLTFDALGDSATITATATDRLGSVVAGAVLDFSTADTSVVSWSGTHVRSVASGQGSITVRDAESGTTATVPVVVDQVATSLTVSSTFGHQVITLPVGSPFPLSCQAVDRNGYAIARDPVLVGSLKGTVSGSGCADARVAGSGYDTLTFASSSVQSRVAVIVATRPDSVGIVAAAQPLTTIERDQFIGEDLANPLILALRPLVNDILAAYGSPITNLGRARAIRDWVARTAIHPFSDLHPDGSTSNISVLPSGKAWADANAAGMGKLVDDRAFWGGVGEDGYAMLDRLLGTLDPATGVRAEDGMMMLVDGVRYRIRDVEAYKYVQCSYQDVMLNVLWAAAGLHGMLVSTVGHDPAAVFIPELGRWVYEDPEFNEEYLLDGTGAPLSPSDLLAISSTGEANRLHAAKNAGPVFDPSVYVASTSYINQANPEGMVIMGSQLNNRLVGVVEVGTGSWPMRYVQIDVPRLAEEAPFNDPVVYARVTPVEAFPSLGVVGQALRVEDSVYVTQLSSTFPGHQRFERRVNGASWETVSEIDVLPVGACRVEYRSLDAVGNTSASAILDVWAPRASGFVEAGLAGSIRRQARYCT